MAKASTATLMGSLTALLLAACSSGNDGMNPAPMSPPITQGGSGGMASQAPPNVPSAGSGGSTAPAPTAGSTASTAGTPSVPMVPVAGTDAPPPPQCMNCKIPIECQGFPLEGIKYSPGGMTLPNKCEPYHPTTNNPYAVRCIDAIPGFETPYPGDEYCILPPPPELGMQVGLHPHGDVDTYWQKVWAGDYSAYTNPPPKWTVEPGGEMTENYRGHSTNTEPKNYYRTYFRMRTGSHHNIITMHESTEPDGWIEGIGDALPGLFDSSSGAIQGVLGGQQRPDDSTPYSLEAPPEDDGLYLTFPAKISIIYNMHHFNFTNKTIVREGWSNIWFQEKATVRASWYMGLPPLQLIGLNLSPGTTADYHYSWNVAADIRLIRVFGHRHFWTPNFSTWIERANGQTELIYQSYDWEDMPTYRYDSVVKNPPLDPVAKVDGATSGVTMLHAGDKLHFNCHITFTDAHAAGDPDAPMPRELGSLRFANQAYTGEMCIQFGNVSGGSLGLPAEASVTVPDFAKGVK